MPDERDIELVNDSLERCTRRREFFDRFYELFRASSDEVAAKFEHTDFRRQNRVLRESFYLLLRAVGDDQDAWRELEVRALRHSRNDMDIRPGLYELWLDCLLQTIREFDPESDAATEAAWRRVMQKGIHFMIAHY